MGTAGEEANGRAHEVEAVEEVRGGALVLQEERHSIDIGDVVHPKAILRWHVGKVGQFLLGAG